ncbi:MAG: hypothetical protein LBG13_01750 [Holosporales bacterium]|nr:hypothetical protein [Holosporales bacterium]
MGFRLGCYVAAVVLGGVVGNTSAMNDLGSATSNTAPIPEYIEGKDVDLAYVGNREWGYRPCSTKTPPLNGQVKLRLRDGDILEGEFENGRMKEKGKLTYRNGNIYEGEFENCIPCGKGKRTNVSGATYEGEFKGGMPCGYGRITYPDGSTYEGNFKHDEFEGEVIHTDSEGVKHIGRFKNDKFVEY